MYKAFGDVRGSSSRSLWWHTWIADCKPLVAYVNRRSQVFGSRWSRLEAFGGIRGLSYISLWWHTWIVVHKPFVATSVDYKPLVAAGVFYKPLVACVDRRSQALGGRWSHLQAFRGIRGSSFGSLLCHTWIVVYMPLVAYVDRRLEALGGIRRSPFTSLWWQMELFTSLWWLAWIAVCKPLVAGRVINKPLVAYVDRRSQAFGGRWSHLQAFCGIRGSSCTRLLLAYVDRPVEAFGGIRGLSFPSRRWLTWITVHKPLVADELVYKPLVACVDCRLQAFGGRWSY